MSRSEDFDWLPSQIYLRYILPKPNARGEVLFGLQCGPSLEMQEGKV